MSGKWTDRGIECSHNPPHLVADKEGVVVCTKRKGERQEVPVGRMMREKSSHSETIESLDGPVGKAILEKLLRDPILGVILFEEVSELTKSNGYFVRAQQDAETKLEALHKRFREVIYEKGLAAPTLEALHDPRFACPKHPTARFQWIPVGYLGSAKRVLRFQRSCLECSLPEHFRNGDPESTAKAYACPHCGIVLGEWAWRNPATERWMAPLCDTEYLCSLCGTVVDLDFGIER